MIRVDIWLARLSTLTQSHPVSNYFESLQKFQGRSEFWFDRYAKTQILLRNSFFSNTEIHMFLCWLNDCLKVNQMFIAAFWFHIANWYWRQLNNIVISYIIVFVDRLHPTKFSVTSFKSSVKSALVLALSQKIFYWNLSKMVTRILTFFVQLET